MFNDHQLRLIRYMLEYIEQYEKNQIGMSQLVGELEGSLYAGEYKDDDFINRFYDFWGPLEEFNAVIIEKLDIDIQSKQIKDAVLAMKSFLTKYYVPGEVD